MGRNLKSPSAGVTIVNKLQVYEGGLGVTTTNDVVSLLGVIPLTQVDVANGVAGLTGAGTLDPSLIPDTALSSVSISGPSVVNMNQAVNYTITNYDIYTTYVITTLGGSLTRTRDVLTYSPPQVAGATSFSINGKVYNITVVGSKPATPVLAGSHVAGNTTGGSTLGAGVYNSSSFKMTYGAGSHLNSDWQISTDVNFGTIARSSLATTVNMTSYIVSDLALSTTYYTRVRHRDNSNNVSDWSNVLTLSTSSNYQTSETAKLTASNKAAQNYFGQAVALTDDAMRCVVGAPRTSTSIGSFYVFLRSGASWSQEKIGTASDGNAGSYFGESVSINSDGTRVAIGAPKKNGSQVQQGAVYIFVRSGTTWTQEQKITDTSSIYPNEYFGTSVSLDSTGTRLVIGASSKTVTTSTGAAFVFLRTGTTWAQEQVITPSDQLPTMQFGTSVYITPDGSRLAVGAYWVESLGAVYTYVRSGASWTQDAKITAPERLNNPNFGKDLVMSDDGTKLVITAPDFSSATGAAYFYTRTNNTWNFTQKIVAGDILASSWFGTSISGNSDLSKIVIGSYAANVNTDNDSGKAYVFDRTLNTFNQSKVLINSDANTADSVAENFGIDVSMSKASGHILVGAYLGSPSGLAAAGAAYFFS